MKLIQIIIVLCLGGCAGNQLKVLTPETDTGLFKTSTILTKQEIGIFKPISNFKMQKFIVVDSYVDLPDWDKDYQKYVKGMLINSGFSNLKSSVDLEKFVIEKGLSKEIPTIDNRIGLNSLSKHTEPFLYVIAKLNYLGHDKFNFKVTIYDPVSSEIKFQASKSAVGYVGIDGPILTPMFNEVKKWVEKSKLNHGNT